MKTTCKRTILNRILTTTLSLMMMFLLCAPMNACAEQTILFSYYWTTNGSEGFSIGSLFETWFYATNTIPEDAALKTVQAEGYMSVLEQGGGIKSDPTSCEVEFISGDERLKEAVKVREETDNSEIQRNGRFRLYVDNNIISEPGEAVFRITLRGNDYQVSTEETLRVLSYMEC